jgi:hypothetical protein
MIGDDLFNIANIAADRPQMFKCYIFQFCCHTLIVACGS